MELFEEHGMHSGYMTALLGGLGGGVRKSAVHRELRALGLKKGMLTTGQVLPAFAPTGHAGTWHNIYQHAPYPQRQKCS